MYLLSFVTFHNTLLLNTKFITCKQSKISAIKFTDNPVISYLDLHITPVSFPCHGTLSCLSHLHVWKFKQWIVWHLKKGKQELLSDTAEYDIFLLISDAWTFIPTYCYPFQTLMTHFFVTVIIHI